MSLLPDDFWDQEDGGPWEFVKAAVVFVFMLVVGYLWLVTLWAAQP